MRENLDVAVEALEEISLFSSSRPGEKWEKGVLLAFYACDILIQNGREKT